MWLLHPILEDHKYFHKFRNVGESTELQDILWAHPDSVKLFNTFPTVLMMDSTYKTNWYKIPLFEIVGVTSTELDFNVGFAFITTEKEENFKWAKIHRLRNLFLKISALRHFVF
jgi:hypothetical protein